MRKTNRVRFAELDLEFDRLVLQMFNLLAATPDGEALVFKQLSEEAQETFEYKSAITNIDRFYAVVRSMSDDIALYPTDPQTEELVTCLTEQYHVTRAKVNEGYIADA